MLDTPLRRRMAPPLDATAGRLAAVGVRAGHVTAVGLLLGVGACAAAATQLWAVALVAWLANRVLDGLDGALARLHGPTDLGGLLDFAADYVVYAGFVLAVAIAEADARIACCFLLSAYLLNVVVLLSLASLLERRAPGTGDERSLRFTPALTEGFETIAAYALICVLPGHAAEIAWVYGGLVCVSVAQRLVLARRVLGFQAEGTAPSTSDG